MSELPTGWVKAALDELAEFSPKHETGIGLETEVSFVPMPSVCEYSGEIIAHETRQLAAVVKGYTHFKNGDVLFAKITPCMENGKAAIARSLVNGLGYGSTEFHVMRPSNALKPEFLWRFLRQEKFREEAAQVMTGAVGQRRVPTTFLKAYSFPVPPAAEQCRIVAKLDALDARAKRARADLDRIPALVARAKQAILEKAFQGELTTHWRANQTKEVPWQTRPLESLIDSGPSNGWSPPSSSDANGAFSLKLTATTSGELRLDDDAVKRIHENPPPDSKYWLMSGDLLIQRANTIEYVGTAAIFDGPEQTFIYPDLMMRVRVDDPILRKYLWRFINSTGAKKYFRDNATGTAGNMPKINGTTVRALAVPVAPAEERTEIVRRIESAFARIDRIAADAASASKLLTRLDQAILTKAFRGELVPQNPEDEPASILLERIRAKTKTAPRKGRGRKA